MRGGGIVIVGAGPAGLATARAYRESGGSAAVTIVGRERAAPYRRPPLTKEFLRGEIAAEELPIEPEEWYRENEVRLVLGREVSAIDHRRGTVSLEGEELPADEIVLATGSEPVRPELPGAEHPQVMTVREIENSRRIAERVGEGTRVIVLGSGFVGCELAGSLALLGAHVTLIAQEAAPQQERLGAEVAKRLAGWLSDLGVELLAGAEVRAIEDGRVAVLEDGRRVAAECVLLGTGARPRVELARDAGLDVEEGALPVDARMRACEGLLAAGDVAFAQNASAGRPLRVEHWGDALAQGEIAGEALAGRDSAWAQVPGFWSTIGEHTLKHAAWGDGYDSSELVEHPGGAFVSWYSRAGTLVGVLTSERDGDYERGRELIERGADGP
ncbi:MAG TPA: FAD-dependent oxidoreductase [Solirubrobacteraceae bacterium]|nr:FAD-dependent oxidoreductase [Solirubrobacteraceae bacterium]